MTRRRTRHASTHTSGPPKTDFQVLTCFHGMIRACSLAQCSGLARNRWRRGQGQQQGQQAQQAVNSHASRGCSFLSIYIRLQEHYRSLCQLLSSSRTVCEMGSSLLLRSSIPETLQLLSWKQEEMKAGRGSVQAWLDTAPSGGLLSRRGASCRSAENEPHNATGRPGIMPEVS